MNPSASEPAPSRPATADELLAHADWVRRLARALLTDPNAADDVAQDAWIAALKRPPSAGDGMRAWWARVVRSSASNHRRSEARRTDRELRVASERAEATDPQVESTLEAHRRLAAAIEALDEPLRVVIVAHYFHGASSRAIADREGVADSTIRTRLQKALEKLRRELDERAGGRERWAVLLAPLARTEIAASASAAGLLALGFWTKCAIAASLVALAGAGAFALWGAHSAPEPLAAPSVAHAALEPAAPPSAPSVSSGARKPESGAASETLAAAAPRAEAFARVEARVLDPRGVPIVGARIACTERARSGECKLDEVPQATSAADGRVALSIRAADRRRGGGQRAGLPPGTWDAELEFAGDGRETRRILATLVLGQSSALGDVVLGDGADLVGRCLASDGTPLARARVELIDADVSLAERRAAERGSFSRSGLAHRAQCAEDGSFALSGVPVGHWRVAASADVRATAFSEPFALVAGERRVLPELLLGECASAIRGRVLGPDGAPCADAEIEYSFGARDEFVGTRPAKDGSFVLEGSASDEVDIYARSTGEDSGEVAVLGARPGEIGIVLRIPEPRHFEVRVVDPDGKPVEKYAVGMYCADGTGGGGTSLAPGGVSTCTARARPFRVTVLVDGCAPLEQGLFTQADVPAALLFRLPASGSVHGRVLRAGAPQASLEVHLDALLDDPRQRGDGLPCIARPGPYAVTQADGSFRVGSERSGRHALWVRGRTAAIEYVRLLEIDPAHPLEGLDLDLEATGSIEGRVEMDAQTSSRAALILYSCGIAGPRAERVTPDGSFRIAGLAPGRWWLRTAGDARSADELLAPGTESDAGCLALDVRAGETQRCTFDVRGPAKRLVTGRVNLGGRVPPGWVAVMAAANRSFDRDSASVLSETGEFTLAPRTFGTQLLALRAPGTPTRDDAIEARVDVPERGLSWSLACELAALDLEGPPGAEVELRAALANGATWITHALLGTDGRAALEALPAARFEVRLAAASTSAASVELAPRGRARLALP